MGAAAESRTASVKAVAPWGAVLLVVVIASLVVSDPTIRRAALCVVLVSMAGGEGLAAFMLVFRARSMAAMAGRPYAAAYHGLAQDFGFYNLAMAALLTLCAVDPDRNGGVLPVAIGLYALHGGTHVLRYLGLYYGGETPIPTRPRHLELRDALPLLVAVVAVLLFAW
jgi:hypothetical protein